jgi:glutamate-1-semialdehyde 2,1-aminomutase
MPGADTRTSLHYAPFPVTLVSGAGARLTDLDGHQYLNLQGDYTAGLYGHTNPAIAAALRGAIDRGVRLGGPHPDLHEYAALLCERFPSLDRVRFTNSGTESNIMALSLARAATGRTKVLVFDGGYHGGVIDFSTDDRRLNLPFEWVIGSYNDGDDVQRVFETHGTELAAVLVEPAQAAGGALAGTRDFLNELREGCDRHGVVLIFDEVVTSRLAPGGLQSTLGITADLTTLGKYLGGGASFGAFGGRAELMDLFDPRREDGLHHAGTNNNNVLSMAAGLTGLRDVFSADVCAELNERGERLRGRLNDVARSRGSAAQVTGVGSVMNIHFQRGPISRRADLAVTPRAARTLFHLEMLLHGFYLASRGMIALSLEVSDEDGEEFVDAFTSFLERYDVVLA